MVVTTIAEIVIERRDIPCAEQVLFLTANQTAVQ
jgi:hypothetical protein